MSAFSSESSDMQDAIAAAADRLHQAAITGTPCAPIRDLLPAGSIDAAYAVQSMNTERALAAGRRLVGRKIGLTSLAVQRQLGVDQPDFGMLFDDMAVPEGSTTKAGWLIQPKAEAEIAFVLGRDLDIERPTTADLIRAIDFCLPVIELVDSRVTGWDIGIVDTIADNASSGLYVLGSSPARVRDVDLLLAGMVLEVDGEPMSTGAGIACLGNPLNAAAWLAGTMARIGRPLRAGDTILSGALGPMVPTPPGSVVEARISGLGRVQVAIGGEAQ